jgi:hypothetical protein
VLPTFQAIQALNEAGVRYMVVGGVATILHGHPRLTLDVDVVVALDRENAKAAIEAVMSAGFTPAVPISVEDFADETMRKSWIEEKNMMVLNMKHHSDPFQGVDIFVKYPMDFERRLSSGSNLLG